MVEELRKELLERQDIHGLPEAEIESEVLIAGEIARTATADGMTAAYQMGVKGEVREWPAETVRRTVAEELRKKLQERRNSGRSELKDSEIAVHGTIAGLIAKSASEEAIGEIHRLGVNHNVSRGDHERPTLPATPRAKRASIPP